MRKFLVLIFCFIATYGVSQKTQKLPDFLADLLQEYEADFEVLYSDEYGELCQKFDLDPNSRNVRTPYFGTLILHKIFTAKTSANCSRGDVMNVPYMWHWNEPNPRHLIIILPDSTPLTQITPPEEFSQYNSFADIDRTPHLFLADMFSDEPGYWSPECGEFYSFGWCSEREMAYANMLRIYNASVRVMVSGAHSWTETRIQIADRYFIVRVDNTYDEIEWREVDEQEAFVWINTQNETSEGKWYQRMATSSAERIKVAEIEVSDVAAERVRGALDRFIGQ